MTTKFEPSLNEGQSTNRPPLFNRAKQPKIDQDEHDQRMA